MSTPTRPSNPARAMYLLSCSAMVGAAALAFSHVFTSTDAVLGDHLDTPGKVFIAERAYGIRDGLSDLGVDVSAYAERFGPIDAERNVTLSLTLAPIYEDAYEKTLRGAYEEADMDAYIAAIETPASVLKQQSLIVTVSHMDVARDEPVIASFTHDLDVLDTQIYDAMWTMRAKAEETGRGEALFDLMMMQVAHDELRDSFGRDLGRQAWGEDMARSFEGFLVATGIVPGPSDVVTLSETLPSPVAVTVLKERFADASDEVVFNP